MNPHASSLLTARPSGLFPFVAGSIVAHGMVAGLWLLLSWALAGPRMQLDTPPIKASLVRLGKARDDKLLPRKEEEPPPPPKAEPAPEPVAAPAPPDTAVKIPTLDTKPDPKPSTPSKPAPKTDARKNLFAALGKAGKQAKPEELEGAADGDPMGDSATAEGERYYGLLKAVVHRHYDVNDTIPEAERRQLRAEVSIWIGNGGELVEVALKKSSGNEVFDNAVIAAVRKAAPYSAPPDHLRGPLKTQGVAFVFRAVD
jgi:TonB family protein